MWWWYDGGKESLRKKVERAAAAFEKKWGRRPKRVWMKGVGGEGVAVVGMEMEVKAGMLVDCFGFEMEEEE